MRPKPILLALLSVLAVPQATMGSDILGRDRDRLGVAFGRSTGENYAPRDNVNNRQDDSGSTSGVTTDPQRSLTLDSAVIAPGLANDGQHETVAGQVPSLTSTNNFINFCLTVPDLPLTNGKQIETGSCNPVPMGTIPSVDNMPSCKFVSPKNNDNFQVNTPFTVTLAINKLITGHFVNAQSNYYAAPQQVENDQILGHSHFVIEALDSFEQTSPTNPREFAFFKGLNDVAINGQLSAEVTEGLPQGAYRACSINTSSNHQGLVVAIAQHGFLDDCVYFTVGAQAAAANSGDADSASAATGDVVGRAILLAVLVVWQLSI